MSKENIIKILFKQNCRSIVRYQNNCRKRKESKKVEIVEIVVTKNDKTKKKGK